MAGQNHLDVQFLGAGRCRFKVVQLEPQQNAVSVWLEIRIPDGAVMVLHVPTVQLKHEFAM